MPAQAENPYDDSFGWTRFDCSASDGLKLAGRLYGAVNHGRLPVICLPGLTRNSADFHELALHLSRHETAPRAVLALDYRGRGMSAWDKNWQNYNILNETDDVIAAATAAGIGEAVIVGTSRGALITMALSALRPGLIAASVMNDAGPEIDGRGLVRIKSYVEKGSDFRNWQDAVNAIRQIGQSQFPDFPDLQWQKHARQILEEKNGMIVRRYDPALMKTLLEINLDLPLPTLWPQFAGLSKTPLLVVRGEMSDLLSVETVKRMIAEHARMELLVVPRQGHAPDLGTPGIPERIAQFIESAEQKRH